MPGDIRGSCSGVPSPNWQHTGWRKVGSSFKSFSGLTRMPWKLFGHHNNITWTIYISEVIELKSIHSRYRDEVS